MLRLCTSVENIRASTLARKSRETLIHFSAFSSAGLETTFYGRVQVLPSRKKVNRDQKIYVDSNFKGGINFWVRPDENPTCELVLSVTDSIRRLVGIASPTFSRRTTGKKPKAKTSPGNSPSQLPDQNRQEAVEAGNEGEPKQSMEEAQSDPGRARIPLPPEFIRQLVLIEAINGPQATLKVLQRRQKP